MDLTQSTVAVLLIAGVVELITRIRARDYWTTITIISAGVVGGLLGISHFFVADPITGIAFGLSASGLITIVGSVKTLSVPAPKTPTV
jgi:uncharacterized membrane protein HdeD (DUF308 family)